MIAEEECPLIYNLGRHKGACQFKAYLRTVELTNLCPSNFSADRIERVNQGYQPPRR